MALRTVSLRAVYEAIDWPVIVLLGALIPVAGAMEIVSAGFQPGRGGEKPIDTDSDLAYIRLSRRGPPDPRPAASAVAGSVFNPCRGLGAAKVSRRSTRGIPALR
jgi:hypothetical protein